MAKPLLRVSGLLKVFPGLTALDRLDLDVHSGEIVAIVGHNGSGKSTLMKILAGAYVADGGSFKTADGTGLHFIHQDLALIGELSAAENLALRDGEGPGAFGRSRDGANRIRARRLVARFGPAFDVTIPVQRLSPAQRAIVAISRALDGWTHSRNVLFLDEPTESLHRTEVEVLFEAVRRLAAEGAGIVFVSHRLDEVRTLAHRIVGLRDGRKVADEATSGIDESQLIGIVTGVSAAPDGPDPRATTTGSRTLAVRGLRGGSVDGIDLDVHEGEILGIAGTLGSGRETVPSLLYGAEPSAHDEYRVAGSAYPRPTPARSIRRGFSFAPADRGRLSIVREMTASENLALPHLPSRARAFGHLSPSGERERAMQALRGHDVRPPVPDQRMSLFSGGNQQKVVMARSIDHAPAVLLLDEPTQGVDVGAKNTIYGDIRAAAAAGSAVLVASSDAKELALICDRVLVMRGGAVATDLTGERITEHRIVAEAYGLPGTDPNPEETP